MAAEPPPPQSSSSSLSSSDVVMDSVVITECKSPQSFTTNMTTISSANSNSPTTMYDTSNSSNSNGGWQEVIAIANNCDDPLNQDTRPVESVCRNLDLYLDKIAGENIGETLQDIYPLSSSNDENGGFVVISSTINSKYMQGYISRFDSLNAIPAKTEVTQCPDLGATCGRLVAVSNSTTSPHTTVVTGFDQGHVVAFAANNLDILANRCWFHSLVTTLANNCNNTLLAAADYAGRLVVADLDGTFEAIRILDHAHDGAINEVRFHPTSEQVLLSAGADQDIALWDLRAKELQATIQCSTVTSQTSAMYWPTDNELIFGSEAGIGVRFDLRARRSLITVPTFEPNHHAVYRIQPLAGGKVIAFLADESAEVCIYNRELTTCHYRRTHSGGKTVKMRALLEVSTVTVTNKDEEKEDEQQQMNSENSVECNKSNDTTNLTSKLQLIGIGGGRSVGRKGRVFYHQDFDLNQYV